MSVLDTIPDVDQLLLAEGSLHLAGPQSASDVRDAVAAALDAAKQAYRVAYRHFDGDKDEDVVDALDLAVTALNDLAADLK